MDYQAKQKEFDKAKWYDSQACGGADACGGYYFCEKCNKDEEYPCARAMERCEKPRKKTVRLARRFPKKA